MLQAEVGRSSMIYGAIGFEALDDKELLARLT